MTVKKNNKEFEKNNFENPEDFGPDNIYHAFFEMAKEGCFMSTPEGKILDCNQATIDLYGAKDKKEMMSVNAQDLYVNEEDRDRLYKMLEKEGSVKDFQTILKNKNGKKRVALLNATIKKDQAGKVVSIQGTIKDISERIAASEALKNSENLLKATFQSIPDQLFVVDRDLKVVYSNRNDEAQGDRAQKDNDLYCYTSMMKSKNPCRNCYAKQVFEVGRPVRAEHINALEQTYKEINAYPILDQNGEVNMVIEHIRDISEQKAAQEELIESGQKLLDIINFLPDAFFAVNTSGEVISWNKAMEKITGVKAKDILGKRDYEYAIPFYGERCPILIDLVFQDDTDIRKKYPFLKKSEDRIIGESYTPKAYNGKGCYCWGIASPLYDTKGNLIGAIESIRDISEKVKVDNDLKASEERYRNIFENTAVGIFQSTPEGEYLNINPSFARIFGFETGEEMKKTVKDIGSQIYARAQDRAKIVDLLEDYGSIKDYEAECRRKDGRHVWISISAKTVRDKSGKISYYEGTVSDIGSRKLYEEAIKESEELFRTLFEHTPVSIWELDISACKKYFPDLVKTALKEAIKTRDLDKLCSTIFEAIEVTRVNQKAVTLFKAKDKIQLLQNLDKIFKKETFKVILDAVKNFVGGGLHYEGKLISYDLEGNKKNMEIWITAVPGYEDKVIITMTEARD